MKLLNFLKRQILLKDTTNTFKSDCRKKCILRIPPPSLPRTRNAKSVRLILEVFNAHFCSFKLQCFEVFVTSFTFFVDMNAVPNSVTLDSWDTLHKIYELENHDLIQEKPIHILSCKTRLCTAGWYKTQLNHEGVCSLFRALVKGFTWTPSSGKSLGLTVSLLRHSSNTGCPRQKWRPIGIQLCFSTKACVSINKLLRE